MKKVILLIIVALICISLYSIKIAINLNPDVPGYNSLLHYYDEFYYPFNNAPSLPNHYNGYPDVITTYGSPYNENSQFHFFVNYDNNGLPIETYFNQAFIIRSIDDDDETPDLVEFVSVKSYINSSPIEVTEYATDYCFLVTEPNMQQIVNGIEILSDWQTCPIYNESTVVVGGFTIQQRNPTGLPIERLGAGVRAFTRNCEIVKCSFGERISNSHLRENLNYANSIYNTNNNMSVPQWIILDSIFKAASSLNEYPIKMDVAFNQANNSYYRYYLTIIDGNKFTECGFGICLERASDFCIINNKFQNDIRINEYNNETTFFKSEESYTYDFQNETGLYCYDETRNYNSSSIMNNYVKNVYTIAEFDTRNDQLTEPILISNNVFSGFIEGILQELPEIGSDNRDILLKSNILELSNPTELARVVTSTPVIINSSQNCDIFNNTVINSIYNIIYPSRLILNTSTTNNIVNCIIFGYNSLSQEILSQLNTFSYCYSNLSITGNNCMTGTSTQLDSNYIPIWNSTTKSPCINSGNPDLDGDTIPWYKENVVDTNGDMLTQFEDRDSDMSRMDIGAKPFLPQENGEYVVENSVIELNPDEINWVCIPGLDGLRGSSFTKANYVFGEQASEYLFSDNPFYLTEIEFDYDFEGSIIWDIDNNIWENINDTVKSTMGYLIDLNELVVEAPIYIEFDGFKAGSTNNDEKTVKVEELTVAGEPARTLAGYFLHSNQNIFEAIEQNTLDKLSRIDTKDWCAINLSERNCPQGQSTVGSTWLTSMGVGVSPTFKYGEAVRFVTNYSDGNPSTSTFDLEWQDTNSNGSPVVIDLPTVFSYQPQSGYYPIVCKFDMDGYDEGDKPIEIAVFVDNECKGAEVIKSDDVILKAYVVDDPSLIGEELTFQLAYSYSKSKSRISNYAVMDEVEKRYVTKKLRVSPNSSTDVAFVSFKKGDVENGLVPLKTNLMGNYPNPFNPTTTINYNIANETNVELNVYNVKGQRVTTLINDRMQPGYHSVTWDGIDNDNKKVSSGVYFYRLKADDKILTKKMMLLK